jgi:hypothetical protein
MAGRLRGRWQNAGSHRPDDMTRHSLREPAQMSQEAKVTLTEGLRRTRTQQQVAGDEDRRRRQGGALGGTAAEVIGASSLRGSVRGAPVEVARGLGRPETHRRRNRIVAGHLPSADQRRCRLPILAMACGAEARGALGGCCGLG